MTITARLDEFIAEMNAIETLEDLNEFKLKIKKQTDQRGSKYPQFVCDCGSKLNLKGKEDHLKSGKHRKWIIENSK